MQDRAAEIDMLLAALRADQRDGHLFLQALATRLEGALPGQIEVQRHGGLFSHEKPVKRIELELGEHRYAITAQGHGRLGVQRTRIVRGIKLKTEELSLDRWLSELAADLRLLAESSTQAREALERLLLGH